MILKASKCVKGQCSSTLQGNGVSDVKKRHTPGRSLVCTFWTPVQRWGLRQGSFVENSPHWSLHSGSNLLDDRIKLPRAESTGSRQSSLPERTAALELLPCLLHQEHSGSRSILESRSCCRACSQNWCSCPNSTDIQGPRTVLPSQTKHIPQPRTRGQGRVDGPLSLHSP